MPPAFQLKADPVQRNEDPEACVDLEAETQTCIDPSIGPDVAEEQNHTPAPGCPAPVTTPKTCPATNYSPADGSKATETPENEKGTPVADDKIYYIGSHDANLRDDKDPNKFQKKKFPEGIMVKRVRELGKASQIEVLNIFGQTGVAECNRYWISTSYLASPTPYPDGSLQWITKKDKVRPLPFNTKAAGTDLEQGKSFYVTEQVSFGKRKKAETYYHILDEDSCTSLGWVNAKEVRKAPQDRTDNFDWMTDVTKWDGSMDKVDADTLNTIKENRSGINDRTDKDTFRKNLRKTSGMRGGHIYSDRSNEVKVKVDGTGIEKKINEIIYKELMSEGSWSSINTYDGEIFTWGRGFAATGQLGQVFKELFKINPKYQEMFRNVGIDFVDNRLRVLDNAGKLHIDKSKKKGMDASEAIRADTQLQSFFIELAEKKDFRDDVAKAQYRVVMKNAGKWPDYIADKAKNAYADSWNKDSIEMIAHLSHWIPAGSWKSVSYKDTKGDILKVMWKYFDQAITRAPSIRRDYAHDVRAWKPGLPVHKKIGPGKKKFAATWPSGTYRKELVFKKVAGEKNKRAYIKGTNKYLKGVILSPVSGNTYHIITPLGSKALSSHTVEDKTLNADGTAKGSGGGADKATGTGEE